MHKFKKGDRVICNCKLKRKRGNGKWEEFTKTKCRIIKINREDIPNYRVYIEDLDRYDIIGEIYLKKDTEYYRDTKIQEILK
jgi:hypothetical protein